MNDAQRHRGPDGEGYGIARGEVRVLHDRRPDGDETGLCGMAHRRLAILDPARGHQPILSADRRFAVLLNGEIYNFQELRAGLSSRPAFQTDGDAEVVVNLCAADPDRPEAWLRKLNGIFALAVWDRRRQRLLLARDPFGVKPLHWVQHAGCWWFASEIKSLLAAGVPARLNRSALHAFMNVRYVPDNQTLFEGIRRFPPGHFAWLAPGEPPHCSRYHEPACPQADPAGTRAEWCSRIRDTFYRCVRDQLISDVPVGISLSGGLDSSMNVAAAHAALDAGTQTRAGDGRLRTFTIGFNEPTDEFDDARLVAEQFGTHHIEARLDDQALSLMREVIRAVEEPKINSLQGYLLARLARREVKVLLSGLGGDELFAGYDIHRYCNTLGRWHARVPAAVHRRLLAPLGRGWWNLQYRGGRLRWEHYRIGGQIALSVGDPAQFYARLRNAWDYDDAMYGRIYADPAAYRDLPRTATFFEPYFRHRSRDYLGDVLRAEMQTKMVNDFLLNEDRVMSAHGVEGRVPFLDPRLVELAHAVPTREKIRGRETKALWKESVGAALPPALLHKKKQGFTFSSYHQWLKDLRGAVEREWRSGRLADTGIFNPQFIRTLLDTPPHPNLRWHYFMAWMMLGVHEWLDLFEVSDSA